MKLFYKIVVIDSVTVRKSKIYAVYFALSCH